MMRRHCLSVLVFGLFAAAVFQNHSSADGQVIRTYIGRDGYYNGYGQGYYGGYGQGYNGYGQRANTYNGYFSGNNHYSGYGNGPYGYGSGSANQFPADNGYSYGNGNYYYGYGNTGYSGPAYVPVYSPYGYGW